MEINEQNLGVLRNILLSTLSPDMKAIKEAEIYVRNIEATQGFPIIVLHLISTLLQSPNPQDHSIRLAAAVLFKNSIKRCWQPVANEDGVVPQSIAVVDRDTIKSHLIDLMCTASPDIQRQLAEAVSIISKYDFPEKWQGLIGQLVAKLTTNDIAILQGVMLTANSIMKKFRYVPKSDELFSDLIVCLKGFHDPLLDVYHRNQQILIQTPNLTKQQLEVLIETRRLMTRIFFSLNWQDIPEVFEDNINSWMTQFAWTLEYTNPVLIDNSNDNEPGPIEKIQAAVIENLNLYASKYDDEFNPFLPNFTQVIWKLLLQVGAQAKYDILATNAIKFLTAVASKQRNVELFTENVLREIIQHIVVRSLTASEFDEELFQDNPTDYIRKDLEGGDQDTRRRCASELVRTLLKFFNGPVSQLCVGYVNVMLEQYRVTMDWKAKDAALHLILAVAVTSSSYIGGAVTLNPSVNIMDLFNSQVLSEIQDLDVNARPIVKADAIKMICIFRSHLQINFLLDLIPHLLRYLRSSHVVIQTYSAYCIERFLTIKDRDVSGKQTLRITKEHFMPYVEPLFSGLFTVLDNPDLPENDYVMKCIMRTLSLLGAEVSPVIQLILSKLTSALERVCKNPSNPHFNHYLFESVALLIKGVCFIPDRVSAVAACNQFEALLFPPFQAVLALDVVEFVPYVFQILAQLLSARPAGSGLSPAYQALFAPLLAPALWERKGNIPALSDLIRAYVSVGMNDIIAANKVEGLLGVFQKLLSAKSSEVYAFKLWNYLILHNSLETISSFAGGRCISTVFGLMLTAMQHQMRDTKTPKYCKYFIHSICLFAATYGGQRLFEVLESLTPGLTTMIILNVWSVNNNAVCSLDKSELKEIIVGATKLFLDTPINQNAEAWGAVFSYILAIVNAESGHKVVDDEFHFVDEEAEGREFDSTYSKLAFAALYEFAPSVEIASASNYFATSLSAFTATRPGQYLPVIQKIAGKENEEMLRALLQSNGVSLM